MPTDNRDLLDDIEGTEQDQGSPEPEEEAKQEKNVPLAALEGERRKRQQLEQDLNSTKEKLTELAELREEMKQWKQAQHNVQHPQPDYWEQPKGYVDAQVEKASKSIDDVKQSNEELRQQVEYFNQVNNLKASIDSQQEVYRKEHDDYDQALDHVRKIQAANLELGGVSPEQVGQALVNNEIQLAATLSEMKMSYPEYIYKMAQNMGYNPSKSDSEDKLDTIEKGQKRNTGGASGKLGEYKRMPEDEFDAAMDEVFGFLNR